MYNQIRVGSEHHRNGEVPKFFQEIWEKQKGQNPLENEKQYDKEDSRQDYFFLLGVCSFVIVIVLAMLGFVPAIGARDTVLNFNPHWLWIPGAFCIIMFVAWIYAGPSVSNDPDRWHWKAYYDSVEKLFNQFNIKPGPEIGKMSRELFQQYIVESLKARAKIVDSKRGFDRPAAMDRFKEMHEAALEWGLCDEKYDSYFPKKAEMQK